MYYTLSVFPEWGIVETVVKLCIGCEIRPKGVEVCLIDAVGCVVSSSVIKITAIVVVLFSIVFLYYFCIGAGLRYKSCYEKKAKIKGNYTWWKHSHVGLSSENQKKLKIGWFKIFNKF